MPIRALTFDADDTLWDFTRVAAEANQVVVDRIRQLHPGFDATAEDLAQARHQAGLESPPGTPFPLIRRRSIELLVTERLRDDPELVDELTDLFFAHRQMAVGLYDDVLPMLETLSDDLALGVITNGNTNWSATSIADHFSFWLAADQVGVRKPDPRIFQMAAAAAGCHPRHVVHVGDEPGSDIVGAQRAGVKAVLIDRGGARKLGDIAPDAVIASLDELPPLIAGWDLEELQGVGVGPHPRPWPDDDRLDPELLGSGDRRNVVDRFRYWRREAIVAELDRERHPFAVAIENWRHDLNIGTVVRTANAFAAASVHIVGERRWNRRGAMVTDRYQHIHHHATVDDLVAWAQDNGLVLVGVDNLPGAEPIESARLPERSMLVFGQEGTGLSERVRPSLEVVHSIRQYGSTRSINAGVAAGIAMHTWVRQHSA